MSDISLRRILPGDEAKVLQVFKSSPAYFLKVDGCEPSLRSVQFSMNDMPKKLSPMYRKEFLFLEYKDEAIGVSDLHVHHPEEGIAYLGQILLSEKYFGRKFGTRFYGLIENYLKKILILRWLVSESRTTTMSVRFGENRALRRIQKSTPGRAKISPPRWLSSKKESVNFIYYFLKSQNRRSIVCRKALRNKQSSRLEFYPCPLRLP